MNPQKDISGQKQIFYRLVSLWVVCEAFGGGLMHGFKIPFSGMIISSLAVTCIILIAYHVPSRSAIIKATVIVAIFKLMLSPHSPPTAYLAVFFQGITGQILFARKGLFRFSAILLAVLGLVESAIQRILVLVIVYGKQLWEALDVFIRKLTGEPGTNSYSLMIAGLYITIHAIAGIFVGIYAYRIAERSVMWKNMHPELILTDKTEIVNSYKKSTRKKRRIKRIIVIFWIILLFAFVHDHFYPGQSIIPSHDAVTIIVRSVLIIMSWLLIVSPLLMMLIRKMLLKRQSKYSEEIAAVTELIPQTRLIFSRCWEVSSVKSGLYRLKYFLKLLLINMI